MNNRLVTIPTYLLKDTLPFLKGTPLEKKINDLLENIGKYQTQNISYFPKDGKVERIVDGDTVVLHNGTIVRYVGITSPETGEPFEKEATEANRKLVEGKIVNPKYCQWILNSSGFWVCLRIPTSPRTSPPASPVTK